jgi:quercetin dioxygenase-like cupin family protein
MAEIREKATLQSGRRISFDARTFRWEGVEPEAYKFSLGDARGMGWRGITRFTLGGPPDIPCRFQMRYFELAPGAYSSLEKHQHIHLIIVIRGKGKALVGPEVFEVAPFDIVYVPPEVPHRWINDARWTRSAIPHARSMKKNGKPSSGIRRPRPTCSEIKFHRNGYTRTFNAS